MHACERCDVICWRADNKQDDNLNSTSCKSSFIKELRKNYVAVACKVKTV